MPEILSGSALIPRAFEIVDLAEQHLRVDDAAGAENAHLAGEDPGGQLAELERLAVDDHRVAGIRPTLVAADDVRLLREQVDDLALPFVAPLRTDDDGGRHDGSVPDLDREHADGRVVGALDADLVAPRARDGGVLAVELQPSLHLRAEEPVLGGALLADHGVRVARGESQIV